MDGKLDLNAEDVVQAECQDEAHGLPEAVVGECGLAGRGKYDPIQGFEGEKMRGCVIRAKKVPFGRGFFNR